MVAGSLPVSADALMFEEPAGISRLRTCGCSTFLNRGYRSMNFDLLRHLSSRTDRGRILYAGCLAGGAAEHALSPSNERGDGQRRAGDEASWGMPNAANAFATIAPSAATSRREVECGGPPILLARLPRRGRARPIRSDT